jgi:predicted RNA-binding Zn ribbon-like protein
VLFYELHYMLIDRTHQTSPPVALEAPTSAFFIADHLALDFLNSVAGTGDARQEFLVGDEQVLAWLKQAGLPIEHAARALKGRPPGALRDAAVALREAGRTLVERRKAGKHGDPTRLNRLLGRGGAYQQLIWKPRAQPRRVAHRRVEAPQDLLVPVAEAIAELLETGDYQLVRESGLHAMVLRPNQGAPPPLVQHGNLR